MMADLYTVTLGLYDKPRFPKRCVVCGEKSPDKRIGVGNYVVSWFGFLTDIPEGWGEVRIPVHSRCQWKFRMERWLTYLVYFVVIGTLYWQFGEQLEEMFPLPLKRIGMKICLAVMLLPVILVRLIFPSRFDVMFTEETADFHFSDSSYASEFTRLNQDKIRSEQ